MLLKLYVVDSISLLVTVLSLVSLILVNVALLVSAQIYTVALVKSVAYVPIEVWSSISNDLTVLGFNRNNIYKSNSGIGFESLSLSKLILLLKPAS